MRVFVPRKGEVNAWDNEDFVKAVRATGKKTLIMAGVWTSVCVMFPALDAKAAGFKVYAVMDASGDPSEMASRTTLARFAQAGIVPTSTNAVLSEAHRTWNRPEAAELAKLYALVAPNYAAVIESYQKAQGGGEAKHDALSRCGQSAAATLYRTRKEAPHKGSHACPSQKKPPRPRRPGISRSLATGSPIAPSGPAAR